MRAGLALIAVALLGGCLLQPSDEDARVSFSLSTGDRPAPPPTGDPTRDDSGHVLLDAAGLHLRVEVSGEGIESPLVSEVVPDGGAMPGDEHTVELTVPAGPARSFSGVAYLRIGEPGTDRTDAGADAFVPAEPVVRDLVEGESAEVALPLELVATGLYVHGTISKSEGVTRPDVTHVALVDLDSLTVLPRVRAIKDDATGEFDYSIPRVPVGRRFALRIYFLGDPPPPPQDNPATEFTLDSASDKARRDIVLE